MEGHEEPSSVSLRSSQVSKLRIDLKKSRGFCSKTGKKSAVESVPATRMSEMEKHVVEESTSTSTEEWTSFGEFDEFEFSQKEAREKRGKLTDAELIDIEIKKLREKEARDAVLLRKLEEGGAFSRDGRNRVKYADLLKQIPENYVPFKVRNRPLTDVGSVYECNAWDDVEWDDEMEQKAKEAVCNNSASVVDPERRTVLENEANSFWDKFYGVHQNKFFRDRNWLLQEFPELESPFGCSVSSEESAAGIMEKRRNEHYPGENSRFKVLEIGCGAGNTVFPLLSVNNHPETYVYCCDFSSTAVDIIRNHDKFQPTRCTPFVLDVTEENPILPFPLGSVDVITSIFVLSAISPEKFDIAIRNLYRFLKPGGLLLFRDYGRYDMAQLRFKNGRCLSDNFYVRGDGTRVYFFLEEEVETLFEKQGFKKENLYVDRRLQVNRSRQLKMYRVWIQAKLRKPVDSETISKSPNLSDL